MSAQPSLFPERGGQRIGARRAINALTRVDPILGELIARVGAFKMRGEHDVTHPVATLARAITGQQLSGRVAEVIYGRLEGLLGGWCFSRRVWTTGGRARKAHEPRNRACE
jgi:3-methyladenine DNA glycosylase/8-oxoguanine DNA glycosylase